MRLLNIHMLKLEDFLGDVPPYAILSHTWGDGEVSLQDMDLDRDELTKKPGWTKIVGFCQAVIKFFPEPLEYVCVDTCCIDKTSSPELSEAINVMFRWYQRAQCCFAYLEDASHDGPDRVLVGDKFEASRWFTRGWTLQELLAPQEVDFFDRNWRCLGSKNDLAPRLSKRTGIDYQILFNGELSSASVAQKMSWAASRQTTRPEDIAYCLLGIFDISMSMRYGEGKNAFIRLQEEILKEYDDHSIFTWDASIVPESVPIIGVLATHSRFFKDCSMFKSYTSEGDPLAVSNKGIHIDIPLRHQKRASLGLLSCYPQDGSALTVGITLKQSSLRNNQYSRTRAPVFVSTQVRYFPPQKLYLTKRNAQREVGPAAVTCLFRHGTLELVSHYPPSTRDQGFSTGALTMHLPYRAPGHVSAAVIFRTTCGTMVGLLLRMIPRERTSQLRLVHSDLPLGSESDVEQGLKNLLAGPIAERTQLTFPATVVTVECTRELYQGSYPYHVFISQATRSN